jgi:hypothetical protein
MGKLPITDIDAHVGHTWTGGIDTKKNKVAGA